jgi:hypothetical protein
VLLRGLDHQLIPLLFTLLHPELHPELTPEKGQKIPATNFYKLNRCKNGIFSLIRQRQLHILKNPKVPKKRR